MADDRTGVPDDAVGRLLHELTVANVTAVRGKDEYDRSTKLREMELQYQVVVSGVATDSPSFEAITINFDYALFFAPGQRESNLEEPHFTYGSKTNPAVGIHATVTEWLQDERNGSVIGAVVAIGAVGAGISFTGKVHLSFQGFGSLIEEDDAPLANEG